MGEEVLASSVAVTGDSIAVASIWSHAKEPYAPQQLADLGMWASMFLANGAALPMNTGAPLVRDQLMHLGALSVVQGEVDSNGEDGKSSLCLLCLNHMIADDRCWLRTIASIAHCDCGPHHEGDWSYGYFHDASYTIFGRAGRLLHLAIGDDGHPIMHVASTHCPVSEIRGVCVKVTDASSYELFLRTAGGDVSVLTGAIDPEMAENEDISILMGTDWVVRAAAGVCLAAKRAGGAAQLLLPRKLLSEVRVRVYVQYRRRGC